METGHGSLVPHQPQTLRIFNKDSGEEHATQVIHDTLLLNKCFLSYAAPAHEQLIKAAFDSFHWKKS